MERQISHAQVIDAALQSQKNAMYLRMPGVVVAYHAATQTADVQPTLSDPRVNPDTGEIFFEAWPMLPGVRVAWPRFGGFVVVGPLAQYDPVVLEAFDLDPSPALAQGRSAKVADPTDVRRLGGNYWLCHPTDLTGPIGDASAAGAALVIGKDGDPAQIQISAGSIQLGRAGGDFVALASKVLTELGKVQTSMASLTVSATIAALATPTPCAVVYGTPYSPSPVASALIKAQ